MKKVILSGLYLLPLLLTPRIRAEEADSGHPLIWHIGADVMPSYVIGTDSFLTGSNPEDMKINKSLSFNLRGGFSFAPQSREGILYPGLYQGLGAGPTTFFKAHSLLSTPISIFAYQGAPFYHKGAFSIGYEWQFGMACGWNSMGGDSQENISVISTHVTAHMGVRLRFGYKIDDRWNVFMSVGGTHFSNGNTSWRNSGLNSAGLAIGGEYTFNPSDVERVSDTRLEEEADRKKWNYDILAFGAWRKRTIVVPTPVTDDDGNVLRIEDHENLCPRNYGVAGLQFSPLLSLNRWVAVGPALDLKWDESAGIRPYWIEGNNMEMKFRHVPFGKQISVGVSAHAELTTPIFSINGGVGVNIINPKGDKAFYQQLAIKVFLNRNLFLNFGYGLGNFKNPNNLMLGAGVRL